MSLTPVEIRHVRLARGVGYRREAVDHLLGDIVQSFEGVWRDRADLADRVEALEHDLARYREMESILRATLVSAESAAADLRERARREAQVIIDEARTEARAVTRDADHERATLLQEARRIRSLLSAALTAVAEAATEREAAPAATTPAATPTFAEAPAGAIADSAPVAPRSSLLDDTADYALEGGDPLAPGFRAA